MSRPSPTAAGPLLACCILLGAAIGVYAHQVAAGMIGGAATGGAAAAAWWWRDRRRIGR